MEVVYYYDNTALGSSYAVSDEDSASVIYSQFEKNGWTVYRVHLGNPLRYHEKYLMLDQAFKGQKYLFPQLNQPNNEALVLAMQHNGIRVGTNASRKIKAAKKKPKPKRIALNTAPMALMLLIPYLSG